MAENKTAYLDKLIEQGNFLAAYLFLSESSFNKEEKIEYTGKIVHYILDNLSSSSVRRSKEKVYFYRSLLIQILTDVPGLARIYRRQLRLAQEASSPFDFLKGIKDLASFSGDKEELKERIEDAMEDFSEKLEDTAEDISDGSIDNSLKDFLSVAEDGIKEGFKGFSDFLKTVIKPQDKNSDEDQEMREERRVGPFNNEENEKDKKEGSEDKKEK